MVEKKGDKFELRSRLFDHAAHNGSNYLDGHCMVSILLSFPVMAGSSIRYQSASAQETRFGIGQQIQASIIFSSFVGKLETIKNPCALIKIIEGYVLSGFKNIQKL